MPYETDGDAAPVQSDRESLSVSRSGREKLDGDQKKEQDLDRDSRGQKRVRLFNSLRSGFTCTTGPLYAPWNTSSTCPCAP
jgi:hypothetical protein